MRLALLIHHSMKQRRNVVNDELIEKPMTLERFLLYTTVICLLFAQYIANDRPWDHIFRLIALPSFVGVICILGIGILTNG